MVAATRTKKTKAKLTRALKGKADWRCPCHGHQVTERVRSVEREDGTLGYGGSYYACPEYRECGYYLNPEQGVVPCVDGNGVALGRLKI